MTKDLRLIIEILLTNSCNRNCSYCIAKSRDRSYRGYQQRNNEQGDYKLESGIINIVRMKKWLLLQKALQWKEIQLVISGGEPTLLRHYVEFLQWCKDSEFQKPILYSNGLNLKDLAELKNPKELVKVLLTKHLDSDVSEQIKLLQELEIQFILKILTDGREIEKPNISNYVVEGIRKSYPDDLEEMLKEKSKYPKPFDCESPYKWRWKGYGDLVNREVTKCERTVIVTVDPVGNLFNCHLFHNSIGSMYEDKLITEMSCQLGFCNWQSDFDFDNLERNDTACELQHYVNLFKTCKT